MDPKEAILLDNGRFRFWFEDGVVRQIEDSVNGETVLVNGADVFGQLRFYHSEALVVSDGMSAGHQRTWRRDDVRCFVPAAARYTQRGPEKWSLTYEGSLNGLDASVTVSTTKESPTLQYEIQFACNGEDGYYTMQKNRRLSRFSCFPLIRKSFRISGSETAILL